MVRLVIALLLMFTFVTGCGASNSPKKSPKSDSGKQSNESAEATPKTKPDSQPSPSSTKTSESDKAKTKESNVDPPPKADDPLAVLTACLKVLGGRDAIEARKTGRVTEDLSGEIDGLKGEFKRIEMFQLPGRLRSLVSGRSADEPLQMTYVFRGEEGWMQFANGPAMDTPVRNIRRSVSGMSLLWTVMDLEEKQANKQASLTLAASGEEIVLRGKVPDIGEVTLQLERDTFYPTMLCVDDHCITYDDYRTVGGLKIPFDLTHQLKGKEVLAATVSEIQFFQDARAELFETPVAK